MYKVVHLPTPWFDTAQHGWQECLTRVATLCGLDVAFWLQNTSGHYINFTEYGDDSRSLSLTCDACLFAALQQLKQ